MSRTTFHYSADRGLAGVKPFAYYYGLGHWAIGARAGRLFVRIGGDGYCARGATAWLGRLTFQVERTGGDS